MIPAKRNPVKEAKYITEEEVVRFSNTRIVRIEVDEDKLKLILHEFKNIIYDTRSWVHVGAGMTAFLLSVTTADFNDVFGLKGAIWNAIFIIAFVLYAVWFLYLLYKSVRHMSKNIIDDTIRKIRGETRR